MRWEARGALRERAFDALAHDLPNPVDEVAQFIIHLISAGGLR